MLPGPTIFRRCPQCGVQLKQWSYASGNAFGARYWTDGRCLGPMLSDTSPLAKCPRCGHVLWLADAEEIDRIDHFYLSHLRGIDTEHESVSLWSCEFDARPLWKRALGIGQPEIVTRLRCIPSPVSKEMKEEVARRRPVLEQFLARAEELRRTSLEPEQPQEQDYLEYAARPALDPTRERWARTWAWWCANDVIRDGTADAQGFPLSGAQSDNLHRLSNLLDGATDVDRITQAEIARELGRFDDALSLLTGAYSDAVLGSVETIRSLCHEQNRLVAEIPVKGW